MRANIKLAQQRGNSFHRAEHTCLRARSRRYYVVCSAKTATHPDKSRSPQSEVSILVPMEQPLAPVPATQRPFGVGKTGALTAAALAVGIVFNKIRRRSEDMGYNYYRPGRSDPFMSGIMRNVNTVQMEELSPDIIAAARARRSRERANHRLDLEEIELPENHPWATRKAISQEQEAAITQRLQVRPRLSQRGAGGPEPQPRVRQQNREL